jgi:hypothetical protein
MRFHDERQIARGPVRQHDVRMGRIDRHVPGAPPELIEGEKDRAAEERRPDEDALRDDQAAEEDREAQQPPIPPMRRAHPLYGPEVLSTRWAHAIPHRVDVRQGNVERWPRCRLVLSNAL